jgi:hypothetical protein
VAARITAAVLTLPRFVAAAAAFTRAAEGRATPEGPSAAPWMTAGNAVTDRCSVGDTMGCAPTRFFGGTTVWPIALRAIGIVLVPAWAGGTLTSRFVFGLSIRSWGRKTPCGGSTGGATVTSLLIGTPALLDAGLAPLAPLPPAPLLAVLARTLWCARASLAKDGFTVSASNTMLERINRKYISCFKAGLGARLRRRPSVGCSWRASLAAIQE